MANHGTAGISALRDPVNGVAAQSPPQFFRNRQRRPSATGTDWLNYNLGALWLYSPPNSNNYQELWMLFSLEGNFGKWVMISGSTGSLVTLTGDVGGPVPPSAGNIDTIGGASTGNPDININTRGIPGTSTVEFNLNNSISQPATTADGSAGLYSLGSDPFMHGRGVSNAFVGLDAGNLNLNVALATGNAGFGGKALEFLTDGDRNTACGDQALQVCTTGRLNSAVGAGALQRMTTGTNNTAIGFVSLENLVSGSFNAALGRQSGIAYTGAESNNLILQNPGVIGDTGQIRIGNSLEHTDTYAAGIYNSAIGATNGIVSCDNSGKLGSSNGANGQLLIGGGTGPTWGNITSGDSSITVTNGANTLALSVTTPVPAGLTYATGTFTPELTFGGATTGITYANRGGVYTKIGDRVFFTLSMQLTSKGSATGAARVQGLPYPATATTVNNDVAMYLGTTGALVLTAGYTWCWGTVFTSTPPNQLELREGNPTTGISDDITDVNFTVGTEGFTIAGSYVN